MTDNTDKSASILKLAKELNSLQFGEFTLSSGQKSNYYFDDRLLSLHPEGLSEIASAFLPLIQATTAVAVGGPTVAADPIVGAITLLSQQAGRPLMGFLVRSEAKAHGMGKQVEGPVAAGSDVAIIDGSLSTGGSMFVAIDAAEAMGCRVVKVISILDRHQGGSDKLRERGYDFSTLLEATPDGDVAVAV
ncbi:MAG: orotate phosphoribosyltransferase [Chloroflexi bacterium]|nr:orotate phosphoribosyltransferase [Chloroflexota bacterium]